MLKKLALFAAIMFASTTTAHADLVDISAGLNFWNNNTNLRAKYHGYENQFNDEKEIIPVIWAKIEHKIPVLPNLKLRYTDLEYETSKTISGKFGLNNKSYTDQSNVTIKTQLNHLDVTPYYNAVNNDTMSLGIGLNLKIGDFKIKATDGANPSELNLRDISIYPYIGAEIKLPFNISIKGNASGLNIAGSNDILINDTDITLAWKMFDVTDLNASIEVGYRRIHVTCDDDIDHIYGQDLELKYKSKGFFAGVAVNY